MFGKAKPDTTADQNSHKAQAGYRYNDASLDDLTLAGAVKKRFHRLQQERSDWDQHWRDLAQYILPRRTRWLSDGRSGRGGKRNDKILDTTGIVSFRALASGMMSGITSPSRTWFRYAVRDPELGEIHAVKDWIHIVEQRIREVLTASNVYSALHNAYEDLGTFGSALIMIVDDYEDVVRAHSVPIGSFWLATGPRGDVDTMYRTIEMTVKMVVEEFGLDATCHATRNHFDEGNYHHPVEVIQCVEPNLNRDQHRKDFAGKPWRSIYWEKGAEEGKFLAKRGYDRKPFVAPRWAVTGLEPYGRSPGMDALGDIKMLQLLQREYLKAIEKQVTPPLQAPVSAQNLKISQVPGKINFVSDADLQRGGIRPLYEVHTPLNFLSEKIRETREAVRQVSFADLFMMMAYSDRRQITAEEIIERRSEKMLGLGPVLERLQDELINPLVDLLFDRVLDAGIVPPPPEELEGHELSIVLISMIAREQRGDEMVAVDRVLAAAGGMAGASPGVIDKIDFDQAIDEYARILGAPPRLVRPDDTVQEMRDARNQQQQQMSQMAMMQQGAETAATLGQANAGPESMLGQLMGAAQGGGADALAGAAAMMGGAEGAPADEGAVAETAAPAEELPQ